jgi:hypothetical protein
MSGPQLQLGLVNVRLAKPAQPGHDPAPVGMRVWLDVPSSRKFDIAKRSLDPIFQEFEIVADSRDDKLRRLKPAGASANAIARIDLSETYWCFWSFGEKLAVENKFQKVAGFGWPLPAPLNAQKDLILPNNRILFLNEFSLSGFDLLGRKDPPQQMMTNRQAAQKFYEDLHIGVIFREQDSRPKVVGATPNSPAPDLFVGIHSTTDPATNVTTTSRLLHDVAGIKKNLAKLPVLKLALDKPPLGPDAEDKTIVVIWVKSFVGPGFADGLAITKLRLFPRGLATAMGEPGVVLSLIFLPLEPRGKLNLAHELGHCLWSDPGQGIRILNDPNLSQKEQNEYRSDMEKMLGGLGLGLPAGDLMKMLEADSHTRDLANLMGDIPQDASDLTFLQIAIMRRAKELRFKGES